jgi:DNA polymerase-1
MRRQWSPETHAFPDLSGAEAIALDIETRDPDLKTMGPGALRDPNENYITGVSLSVGEGQSWYFPTRHASGKNMDEAQVTRYLNDTLSNEKQEKVGANILYDAFWLRTHGVNVQGMLRDVQVAEPLLNEHRFSYSLDALGQSYFGEGKTEEGIYNWVKDNVKGVGKNPTQGQVKGNLWRVPVDIVTPYATQDAVLPLRILEEQRKQLAFSGLTELFDLESRLTSVLLNMKLRGMPVATNKAHEVEQKYAQMISEAQAELNRMAGFEVSVNNAGGDLEKLCNQLGIKIKKTAKDAPSFTADWLKNQGSPELELVRELRQFEKFNGTFVQGSILKYEINGRIHGNYKQVKGESGGTVSGRLSASNPNLQNQESRDPERGKLLRSLFIPEEGERFVKADYKAIEPRIALHYAKGPAAEAAREFMCANPDADVYEPMLQALPDFSRSIVKSVYLGLGYGMGLEKLAKELNCTPAQAKVYRDEFNKAVPYIKELSNRASRSAKDKGHIRTILGRYSRFTNAWETSVNKWPSDFTDQKDYYQWREDNAPVDSRELALKKWGGAVQPAYTYRAFNRLCQGGSADILKKAMVDLEDAGVYAAVGYPLNNVHDELDFSVPYGKIGDEALGEIRNTMENAVELRVPLRVDMEIGPNWGEVK